MSDDTERDVVRLAKVARAAVVEHFGDEPLRGVRGEARGERVTEVLRHLGGVAAFGELRALLEPQFTGESAKQCARLYNTGRCESTCPNGCDGPFAIAYRLRSERELVEALIALHDQDNGGLNVTLQDAEVRRAWNAQRGLVQRIQPNTLFRGGEPTRYGRFLLAAMDASALRGLDIRWALSWLSDLYDDACDMGEVVELREPNTPEGLAGARYGHIAYRVLGRRTGDEQRVAIDAALPAEYSLAGVGPDDVARRNDRYRQAVRRVDAIGIELFGCLEIADNAMLDSEEPIWSPIIDGETPEAVLREIERGLDARGMTHRRFEQDDGDLVIEVLVHPRDLPLLDLPGRLRGIVVLDDFFAAWAQTRRGRRVQTFRDAGDAARERDSEPEQRAEQ